ncbi:hypothetical protein [Sorangium sp. So ce204]|uniref:hypothetical protein n=1 Tax=Sorangium sp. So ce204 TaxID=3133288 RepID=UPI003F634217
MASKRTAPIKPVEKAVPTAPAGIPVQQPPSPAQRARVLASQLLAIADRLEDPTLEDKARRRLADSIEAAQLALWGISGEQHKKLTIMDAMDFAVRLYTDRAGSMCWADEGEQGLAYAVELARFHIRQCYPVIANRLSSERGRALVAEAILAWMNKKPGARAPSAPGGWSSSKRGKWVILAELVQVAGLDPVKSSSLDDLHKKERRQRRDG